MIRLLITRFLIRLLDPHFSYHDIKDDDIREFLAGVSYDLRFQQYFRKRDLTILKALGTGLDREHYLMMMGQRVELLTLLSKVDEAHKVEEANRKRKEKETEANQQSSK